ncbi:hypothetical protein [Egbenema bharatensis]|uniref:hypothetical protein n=1 Tax=Egbenema bharatensis TaxID=3463334 RepID=UPI003A8460B9
MTQDVKQWLTEIKLLQQKVADAQQEREEAYASAANWRNLYETEAKQRRAEVNLAQQTIESLTAKLQELQTLPSSEPQGEVVETIQAEVEQLQDVEALKEFLIRALSECDRLTRALTAEQLSHAQTRKELTSALGDTMDLLTRERGGRQANGNGMGNGNSGQAKGNAVLSASVPTPSAMSQSTSIEATDGSALPSLSNSSEVRIPSLELPQFD